MATQVFTIPQTTLSVGTHGPFTSPITTFSQNGYSIAITKTADWPASGQVCVITIEDSFDGGTTWNTVSTADYTGGPWPVKGGGTTNTSFYEINYGTLTPPNRMRFTIVVSQQFTASAVISSL